VLALHGSALQAWSYDRTGQSCKKLPAPTPLALSSDPWDNHPEYYSTIQTGDVNGDGRDDVIARGPFGIRTWLYNRRGTGGWESYLPPPKTPTDTYPQFSGGQAAAFAELNKQAKDRNLLLGRDSARAVWTDEDAPAAFDLENLRTGIIRFAGCSGSNPDSPPCTPPAGSSGFSADDWTAVVQEILAEISLAQQVVTHFSDLDDLRRDTFIAQTSALPAIGDQLKLAGPAGNQTDFDVKEAWASIFGIAGAIAGLDFEPLGAALEIAGSVLSALPSASPTLTSEFDTTYSGLASKFASAVQEVEGAGRPKPGGALELPPAHLARPAALARHLDARQSGPQERGQRGLRPLYLQEAPAHALRQLRNHPMRGRVQRRMPWPRRRSGSDRRRRELHRPPPHGGLSPTPCTSYPTRHGAVWHCDYTTTPPADLATTIFGPVSPTCAYQPGNAHTAWTFGCNLGVNEQNSISLSGGPRNGWNFSSYCGDPFVGGANETCATGWATVGARGRLPLGGRTILPRRFRLERVRVVAERLLYERGRRGEPVRGPSGRALGPVRMSRRGPRGVLKDPPGGPRVRLRLRRLSGRRVAYVLRARRLRVRVPAACHALPASDALTTPHVRLHVRLRISDGGHTRRVSLPLLWRCVRARHGAITALRTVRPEQLPARRGLRVSLRGPRSVRPGTSATYRLRVRNRPSARAIACAPRSGT
jgi:hypothetical protein